MYRSERDESKFTPAQKVAWHIALPYTHVPIIDDDRQRAERIEKQITKLFTADQLAVAAARLDD